MSVTFTRRLVCPHCERDFPADVYWSLHASRSPQVREALLARRFQRFYCPGCGGVVLAEPSLLYTDFPRRQWFATFPRRALPHRRDLERLVTEGFEHNMRLAAPPMVQAWADEMQVRVVFGLPHLREKLLLAEAGLDDRVVERLKLALLSDVSKRLFEPTLQVVVQAVRSEHLEVTVEDPAGADRTQVVRSYRVPISRYQELEGVGSTLPPLCSRFVVDWRDQLAPEAPLPAAPDANVQALLSRLGRP